MADDISKNDQALITAALAKGAITVCPERTYSASSEYLWDPASRKIRGRVVIEEIRKTEEKYGSKQVDPDMLLGMLQQGHSDNQIALTLHSTKAIILQQRRRLSLPSGTEFKNARLEAEILQFHAKGLLPYQIFNRLDASIKRIQAVLNGSNKI